MMDRDNLLKTVHFDHPEEVPVIFHINPSCRDHYPRGELAELILDRSYLFPEGLPDWVVNGAPVPYAPFCRKGEPWTDPWGCVWENGISGYMGAVTRHSWRCTTRSIQDTVNDIRITVLVNAVLK